MLTAYFINWDLAVRQHLPLAVVLRRFFKSDRSARSSARREGDSALSFVSFSLGLFFQRKAAKEFWCLKIVTPTLITAHLLSLFLLRQEAPLSCLTYVSHLLRKIESEKALQKENAVFCANAARATAFEKAVQNNRSLCANIVTDKSKFEFYTTNKKVRHVCVAL